MNIIIIFNNIYYEQFGKSCNNFRIFFKVIFVVNKKNGLFLLIKLIHKQYITIRN